MHGTSRIVLRASALGLVTAAAVAACSDGSSSDMEFKPGAATYPQEGASSSGSEGGSIYGDTPPLPPDGNHDGGSADAGDAEAGSDAASDAGADAADATADADAGVDAGNDPTLGVAALSLTFAGLGVGIDSRILTATNFAGNSLNAWADSAAVHFDHGTTTVSGTGSAAAEIAWGQWSAGNATLGGTTYVWPANGGAIYVVGQNHTGAFGALGQLPATFVGATPAISASGGAAVGTVTGNAGLYEGAGLANVGFDAAITLGADTYTLSSLGGAAVASTSELVLDANAQFSHTYAVTSASAYCGGSCNATVKGFVGGPNGEDIALVIHIYKNASGEAASVSGGLAFTLP